MEITERHSEINTVCEKIEHFSWCDFVAKLFSCKKARTSYMAELLQIIKR